MLTNAVEASVQHRRAHVAVLRGEAGIGKTRLATEVARWAEAVHGAQLFRGRCLPYGEVNVWWPIAEALRGVLGLEADTPEEEVPALVAAGVAEAFGPGIDEANLARTAEGIRHLLGYETSLSAFSTPSGRPMKEPAPPGR